jgi:hypothetical protein
MDQDTTNNSGITSYRFIRIKQCDIFSDAHCESLISECGETLRELYLQRCKELTDASLSKLERLSLEIVDFSSCDNFSTEAFNSFLTSQLLSLREIRLRKCPFVTEESILHLVTSSSIVSLIDLSFCENVFLESLVQKLLQVELQTQTQLTIVILSLDEYSADFESISITPALQGALDILAKQGITITQNLYRLQAVDINSTFEEESSCSY